MFLDNLSVSILQLCATRRLSYEAASERCHLSSRYFGDIARGRTAPTILTLEKLCVGFDLTPNDLLIPSAARQEQAFREAMTVTRVRYFQYPAGQTDFPVCPRCGITLEREYQTYCDRCGQCLNWNDFSEAVVASPEKWIRLHCLNKNAVIIANIFKKQKGPLGYVLILALGYIVISALIVFNVEPDSFRSFFEAIYWATVSLTTMGYGDIYPVTAVGRIVTMVSSVFGIAIVALPAGIITAGYLDELAKLRGDESKEK